MKEADHWAINPFACYKHTQCKRHDKFSGHQITYSKCDDIQIGGCLYSCAMHTIMFPVNDRTFKITRKKTFTLDKKKLRLPRASAIVAVLAEIF